MSRIDELQRMHEDDINAQRVWSYETEKAMSESWPAIHRVLVAARKWARAVEMSGATSELTEALRALDGGA